MNTYNLFISHAWKYNNGYYKVVDWLDSAVANKEFNYKNYSVPQHDPIIDPDTNVGKNQLKELLKIHPHLPLLFCLECTPPTVNGSILKLIPQFL